VFEAENARGFASARITQTSTTPISTSSTQITPSAGYVSTPSSTSYTGQAPASFTKAFFDPSAKPGNSDFIFDANGSLMSQNETWDGSDWDISKWFDIPNLSYDEESMGQMVELAKQTGITFSPRDIGNI
jgi:hypothetical protein